MVEYVCPNSGKFIECERDCCQHRGFHEHYDRCDIPTCGRVVCVAIETKPIEEPKVEVSEVPDYHSESLGEVGK